MPNLAGSSNFGGYSGGEYPVVDVMCEDLYEEDNFPADLSVEWVGNEVNTHPKHAKLTNASRNIRRQR